MGEVDRYFFVDGSAGVDAANSNRRGIGYRITEFVVRKMFASLGLSNPRDSVTRDEFVQRIVESGQVSDVMWRGLLSVPCVWRLGTGTH